MAVWSNVKAGRNAARGKANRVFPPDGSAALSARIETAARMGRSAPGGRRWVSAPVPAFAGRRDDAPAWEDVRG